MKTLVFIQRQAKETNIIKISHENTYKMSFVTDLAPRGCPSPKRTPPALWRTQMYKTLQRILLLAQRDPTDSTEVGELTKRKRKKENETSGKSHYPEASSTRLFKKKKKTRKMKREMYSSDLKKKKR